MTNWHDPMLEAAEGLALIKLVHVLAGLYCWEFVLNFDYEYSITTRQRKFSWTALLYLACRWSTLLAMVVHLLDLDASYWIYCEAQDIMLYVSSYFAFQSATWLIILRTYALWERKRIIVAFTLAIWLADNTIYIYVIAITRMHRNGTVCEIMNVVEARIAYFTSYISHHLLLFLMLFGVLRWRQARQSSGIWQLMYTQGLIYVLVATLAYTPTMILLALNLNEPMDSMFMFPPMIIMSISALRMHRGLVYSIALNSPPQGQGEVSATP